MATRSRRCSAWLLAALLAACAPETDQDRYEVGESGRVTFRNETLATLYLGGCGHFDYEKRIGEEWLSQAPDTVCVWEGFADPVAPGSVVTEPFRAREPGTWRLRYAVGAACSESAPLDERHCAAVGEVASNEFQVLASSCVVGGCSGQLCAEEPLASTCEWLPHYACFREARCGRFGPEGGCAWEPTPELEACLERLGSEP
jgi:eight-cysteine-cluster-containing protein